MPYMQEYKTSFTLDKAYFQECFEQSAVIEPGIQAYKKAIAIASVGALLVLFTEVNDYAAWFIFCLGVLEAVSTHYRKPWWVTRQMLSRASKSQVELIINDEGIFTKSRFDQVDIPWSSIAGIESTELGWLIKHQKGRTYLSNSHLSEETRLFIEKEMNK